jgi:predicted peptidase
MLQSITKSLATAAILCTTLLCAIPSPASADQVAKTSNATIVNNLQYLLYTPEGYDGSDQKFPLVVWLHGGDQSGSDIEKLKTGGLPKMIAEGQKFPFLVFSPQNLSEELLFPIGLVKNALDQVVSDHRVDASRIYLVGYSRGGFGAWSMAEQFPETFAAIVPIAGGGIRHYLNRTNENAAFWVFHGEEDETIPLSDSVVMFLRLKELKRNARLSVLEGVDHAEVETATLSDPQLFEWLLQQQLKAGDDAKPQ